MLTSTYGVVLVLAQVTLAGPWLRPVERSCCDVCGVEKMAIAQEIVRLQTCPNWRVRDNAAHALRRFDWHCHPEIVDVLATALLKDCHEEVREESAQSLTKLAPCVPIAHEALSRAALADPDHATRHWARKGLKAVGRRCEGHCNVCAVPNTGPLPVPSVVPAPTVPSGTSTSETVVPPAIDSSVAPRSDADLPEAIPGPAPSSELPKLEGPRTGDVTSLKGRPRPGILGLGLRAIRRD